jgi:hypothetical protein
LQAVLYCTLLRLSLFFCFRRFRHLATFSPAASFAADYCDIFASCRFHAIDFISIISFRLLIFSPMPMPADY